MKPNQYIQGVVNLAYDPKKCVVCGLCVIVCPHRVFQMEGKRATLTDVNDCMECGACQKNCPVDAIQVRAGVG